MTSISVAFSNTGTTMLGWQQMPLKATWWPLREFFFSFSSFLNAFFLQKWYVERDVENIDRRVLQDRRLDWLVRDFPMKIYPGSDRGGVPMFYTKLAGVNIELARKITDEEFELYLIYFFEGLQRRVVQQRQMTKLPIYQSICIADFSEFGWSQVYGSGTLLTLIAMGFRLFQRHFPSLFQNVLFINVTSTFPFFFTMFQPLLYQKFRERLEIHGPQFRERLLKQFAPENLPVEWGGVCPVPVAPTSQQKPPTQQGVLAATVHLSERTIFEVPVQVVVPGSWVSYEFKTERNAIDFAAFRGVERHVVVPLARYDWREEKHHGRFQAHDAGTFTLVFENRASPAQPRTLSYQVLVHALSEVELMLPPARLLFQAGAPGSPIAPPDAGPTIPIEDGA
eukprot:TRINITY_DN5387_c0_g1_i1.p1 TRINITY_DN5387_c0_g1~~TRINITY_DN5387_c0_g1_i1.p1  ORF type:complete len:395 (+),score=57.73 TRINITY_DN5387_c0_g1_i1:762-1946(+)